MVIRYSRTITKNSLPESLKINRKVKSIKLSFLMDSYNSDVGGMSDGDYVVVGFNINSNTDTQTRTMMVNKYFQHTEIKFNYDSEFITSIQSIGEGNGLSSINMSGFFDVEVEVENETRRRF
jgi:hypothetical protein